LRICGGRTRHEFLRATAARVEPQPGEFSANLNAGAGTAKIGSSRETELDARFFCRKDSNLVADRSLSNIFPEVDLPALDPQTKVLAPSRAHLA